MCKINYVETVGERITVEKIKTRTPDSVTLELSFEEAQTLTQLLSAIGGCERNSLRKYISTISDKLHHMGFCWDSNLHFQYFEKNAHRIYATNESHHLIGRLCDDMRKRLTSIS